MLDEVDKKEQEIQSLEQAWVIEKDNLFNERDNLKH